jgi:methionyl-tRNA formyltransferase
MLSRVILTIDENETSGELEARLATAGAALLTETVDRLASGTVPELPQDESLVTYAHRLTREDSPIEWDRPAVTVHNQIRGLNPWPLAAARLDGRRLLLRRSVELADKFPGVPPGTVSRVDGHVLVVACQDGSVGLTMVQPEGRASMSVREFLNGHDVHVGARFEP